MADTESHIETLCLSIKLSKRSDPMTRMIINILEFVTHHDHCSYCSVRTILPVILPTSLLTSAP